MKKFLMVLCSVLTFGLVLAGCSTVGMIENTSNELIYNGNAGVNVSNYLYFGNAFNKVESLTDLSSLNDVKSSSFLARINLEDIDAKGQNFTPNDVEKVIASEAIGQENQFMFAIGDYIYYLKPDVHVYYTGDDSSYQFGYSVLCSVRLDGDKNREIYTYQGAVSNIEVLKYGDRYYVVTYAGSNLFVTRLSNGTGTTHTLGENVTSVAIPETTLTATSGNSSEWNGMIYFTSTDDDSNTIVSQVKVDATSASDAETVGNKNGVVNFVYRQNDLIFYTHDSTGATYFNNVKNLTPELADDEQKSGAYKNNIILIDNSHLLSRPTVSNIHVLRYGNSDYQTIIYTANSTLNYKNNFNGGGSGTFTITSGTTDLSSATVIAISGNLVYLSTSSGIYEADISKVTRSNGEVSVSAREIVSRESEDINTTLTSYDGEYIYFYAGLEALTEDEQELINAEKEEAGIEISEEEEDIASLDDGVYLYRVSIDYGEIQLLGITEYEERHSSYRY